MLDKFLHRRHDKPSLRRNLKVAVITAVYWTGCLAAPTVVGHLLSDSIALHM